VTEDRSTPSSESVAPDEERQGFGADGTGTVVSAYLLAGPLTYGVLGGLLDRWLGTGFFTPIGIVLGMALALYVVWLRYGRS